MAISNESPLNRPAINQIPSTPTTGDGEAFSEGQLQEATENTSDADLDTSTASGTMNRAEDQIDAALSDDEDDDLDFDDDADFDDEDD